MNWRGLHDEERQAVVDAMPGGIDGFLKGWGWKQFAQAIEDKLRDRNEQGPREVRYECDQHGIWNALRESGCPRCVEYLRKQREEIIAALDLEHAE